MTLTEETVQRLCRVLEKIEVSLDIALERAKPPREKLPESGWKGCVYCGGPSHGGLPCPSLSGVGEGR